MQKCALCGISFEKSGKIRKQKFCGNWRDKTGCSWKNYQFRVNKFKARTRMKHFLLEKYPEIYKEYLLSL